MFFSVLLLEVGNGLKKDVENKNNKKECEMNTRVDSLYESDGVLSFEWNRSSSKKIEIFNIDSSHVVTFDLNSFEVEHKSKKYTFDEIQRRKHLEGEEILSNMSVDPRVLNLSPFIAHFEVCKKMETFTLCF